MYRMPFGSMLALGVRAKGIWRIILIDWAGHSTAITIDTGRAAHDNQCLKAADPHGLKELCRRLFVISGELRNAAINAAGKVNDHIRATLSQQFHHPVDSACKVAFSATEDRKST